MKRIKKDDQYSSTKLNKMKQKKLIFIIKKESNLIIIDKLSYNLKYNLFLKSNKTNFLIKCAKIPKSHT